MGKTQKNNVKTPKFYANLIKINLNKKSQCPFSGLKKRLPRPVIITVVYVNFLIISHCITYF